ncbi:MAG: MBL fold metallo-hydrolase [Bacteroidales bacterium]|jgi:glyoxylase-like metal-dependent hydrolase (beta-lactamase superfamily II)|nr:MBL fold metallo-hydrolase [Bacteroidales bacterium]MCI2122330.1 MBL fold metallo-hydrolase [Bacteroidales bacterium]MCI2145743.1 MBL fold metallo-hydrolase [Bacteroidales bacterium]
MSIYKGNDWFTIEKIDDDTYVISEYKHWEETHCYLLNGKDRSLLIDTGLGVGNIWEQVRTLTDKHVTAVTTHVHYDHFGGHKYFPDFYVHEAEKDWINGEFPLTIEQVRYFLAEKPCDFPEDFDINKYQLFKGTPTRVLKDNDTIELGGRTLRVLHTPGHSPGHMCFFEEDKGYLYTGDLIYIGDLFAYFPSTDPVAYMNSIKKLLKLLVKKILPAHHDLNVPVSIIKDMDKAFTDLYESGKLKHGSGTFSYSNFGIKL